MKRVLTLKDIIRQKQAAGENLPALDAEPIKAHFHPEPAPDVDETPAGRVRLLHALNNKHGVSYAQKPEVRSLLAHYDKEAGFLKFYKQLLTMGAKT